MANIATKEKAISSKVPSFQSGAGSPALQINAKAKVMCIIKSYILQNLAYIKKDLTFLREDQSCHNIERVYTVKAM